MDVCGTGSSNRNKDVALTSGFMTSPNYPHRYPPDTKCRCVVNASTDQTPTPAEILIQVPNCPTRIYLLLVSCDRRSFVLAELLPVLFCTCSSSYSSQLQCRTVQFVYLLSSAVTSSFGRFLLYFLPLLFCSGMAPLKSSSRYSTMSSAVFRVTSVPLTGSNLSFPVDSAGLTARASPMTSPMTSHKADDVTDDVIHTGADAVEINFRSDEANEQRGFWVMYSGM